MWEVGLRQIPPKDLVHISVPTTLMWGKHDRVAPLRTAVKASARYGWPLQVIEDAGHLSPAEQPETFMEELRTALGPLDDSKGQ
jgi:pimeloyl-ACP methyl ester carboxylesterase